MDYFAQHLFSDDTSGEAPLTDRAVLFTSLTQPIAMEVPPITKEAAEAILKVAVRSKYAQSPEEISRLAEEAYLNPNYQVGLDHLQAVQERDQAIEGMQQQQMQMQELMMQTQAASQQAQMAQQQAQMAQQQAEQETAARQQAAAQAMDATDQSLADRAANLQHRASVMQAADEFSSQADQLLDGLRQVAAAPPQTPSPETMGIDAAAPMMAEGGSRKSQQEAQQAQNAEQEAAVQGQQAEQAAVQDQVQAEQAQVGQEAAPEPGGGIGKVGSMNFEAMSIDQLKDFIKTAQGAKQPAVSYPQIAAPPMSREEAIQQARQEGASGGASVGTVIGGVTGAGLGGLASRSLGRRGRVLAPIGGALAGTALGALGGRQLLRHVEGIRAGRLSPEARQAAADYDEVVRQEGEGAIEPMHAMAERERLSPLLMGKGAR